MLALADSLYNLAELHEVNLLDPNRRGGWQHAHVNTAFNGRLATGEICSLNSQTKPIELVIRDWKARFGVDGMHKVLHLFAERRTSGERRSTAAS